MRRLSIVLVLALAAVSWPAAAGAAQPAMAAARAAGSLEADFNNDGFADLAVGVPEEGVGGVIGAGVVQVLYGTANGLSGTGSQLFQQGAGGVVGTPEGGAGFGRALAAGDFNNDGFADLAVGVFGANVGAIIGAGAVEVLYGSAAGLTGAGSQLFRQGAGGVGGAAEEFDLFGVAVAAGDFNRDGFADLGVGVPFEDIGAIQDAGAVNVLYGSAGGVTAAGNQQFWQGAGGVAGTAEASDMFGRSLVAGDFSDNGLSDLAVGVPNEDIGATLDAGAINVLYGSVDGLSSAGNQQFWQGSGGAAGTLEANDHFGSALAAGDFDGDGPGDLAVGVPLEGVGTVAAAGSVDVLYGTGSGLNSAGAQQFWQGAAGVAGTAEEADLFGRSLAAGDFNDNTFADLAVGVAGEDVGDLRDAGAINVLYGSGGGLSSAGNQQFWQGAAGVAGTAEEEDLFGWAVSAGDFDNDGAADLAVGVLFETVGTVPQAGAVNVLYGTANGLSGIGSQLFRQGAGGVGGTPEPGDSFGEALVGSDQPTGGAAASSPARSGRLVGAASRDR
jgi:hypothetical protein